jgi:hypothetical protein
MLEASVHSQMSSLLLDLWPSSTSQQEHVVEQTVTSWQLESKKKGEKESQGPNIPLKGIPSVNQDLPLGLTA